jgi:purine nucleosidase
MDCDPGIDDALAIALAVRHCDVLALTTVGGNVSIEHTTRNAGSVLAMLGRSDIPVHQGADHPLRGPISTRAAEYHGLDGLGGVGVPGPVAPLASTDAPQAIVDLARANPGCWLVPTGPLTNVALAVQLAPDLHRFVAGISWMGGSTTHGNATPSAEFNVLVDPEAANEVVRWVSAHSVRFVMAGLNVTHDVTVDEAELSTWSGTPLGASFAALLAPYLARYRTTYTLAGAAMHDAMAVVAVTHPDLVTCEARHMEIDVSDGPSRGRTIVDDRPLLQPMSANTEVMVGADAPAVIALIRAAVMG